MSLHQGGTKNVDHSAEDIQAELIDLTEISIEELHRSNRVELESSLCRILGQIDRPRVNIGSGQPGRID
jgi:hypothetical protein